MVLPQLLQAGTLSCPWHVLKCHCQSVQDSDDSAWDGGEDADFDIAAARRKRARMKLKKRKRTTRSGGGRRLEASIGKLRPR